MFSSTQQKYIIEIEEEQRLLLIKAIQIATNSENQHHWSKETEACLDVNELPLFGSMLEAIVEDEKVMPGVTHSFCS